MKITPDQYDTIRDYVLNEDYEGLKEYLSNLK